MLPKNRCAHEGIGYCERISQRKPISSFVFGVNKNKYNNLKRKGTFYPYRVSIWYKYCTRLNDFNVG